MRIVCLSDTHNQHRSLDVPPGDILIHAGDSTFQGTLSEVSGFLMWMDSLPHPHKILIAGNHDWLFEQGPDLARMLLSEHPKLIYLQDSGCEVAGLKIWGSPWQPEFGRWAFNLKRRGARLREAWNKIPLDTDILITHGPPFGVLDQLVDGERVGCEVLAERLHVVHPKLHVFGHIHWAYGRTLLDGTCFVNASNCDEGYRPVNPSVVVDLT